MTDALFIIFHIRIISPSLSAPTRTESRYIRKCIHERPGTVTKQQHMAAWVHNRFSTCIQIMFEALTFLREGHNGANPETLNLLLEE